METPLCNFEQFQDLENLGMPYTTRPTLDQAIRWFREVKGIHGWVESEYLFDEWRYRWTYRTQKDLFATAITSESHDEAASALVDKLIEIAKA